MNKIKRETLNELLETARRHRFLLAAVREYLINLTSDKARYCISEYSECKPYLNAAELALYELAGGEL